VIRLIQILLGELTALPKPLVVFKGLTSKGRAGEERGGSFPILVTERWAGADPGVQGVSPQVT